MSYGNREKKRKKKKIYRGLIVSSIFLYLIFRSVPSLLANNAKTILPETGVLIEKISGQGFMLLNETVIKSTGNGELELYHNEGERIAAGTHAASINSLNDTSSLKQELIQIEKSISALKKSEAEVKFIISEKDKIEDFRQSLVDELQEMIVLGQYDKVYILKEQLVLYEDKANDASFSNTLVGQSLENLNSRKEGINAEINSNHIKYYSSHAGIISHLIDGYEEIYLPKDFENYTYDNLVLSKNTDKNKANKATVSVGEPIYKIIDNFEWYIAIKIDDLDEIKDLKVNQGITIQLKGEQQELKARIVAINTSGNKGVVIVRLNTMLHDYYNLRFPEVDIVKFKMDGLKVPNQAIIEKDSIKGVYIKDKSGIVKFRPVNIIGQDENYTYVDKGDGSGNIELNGSEKTVRTIALFDEIFLNTINIKEGQILN